MIPRLCIFLLASWCVAAGVFGETPPAGGGGFEPAAQPGCLDSYERQRILTMIGDNVARLRESGTLRGRAAGRPLLSWPLARAAGLVDAEYHGISSFVDLDPAFPDSLLDYNCGERSYDLSDGYNHQGVDYFTWPFWWFKMEHDQVEVVAAAPGTLIGKDDGFDDRSCTLGGAWNAAYLLHDDGSQTWYGHLKDGSITTKPVGSFIAAGEYLGIVGSSGSSLAPHLHMEVLDSEGAVVEPYTGPCQPEPSWWASQREYFDSGINLIATHDEPPEFPACPMTEVPNLEQFFSPGDTVHVALYYRDILAEQVTHLRILLPGGDVWQEWDHSFATPEHYSGAYWFWTWFLPLEPEGWWTFEATFEGVLYAARFAVGTTIFIDGFESSDLAAWNANHRLPRVE